MPQDDMRRLKEVGFQDLAKQIATGVLATPSVHSHNYFSWADADYDKGFLYRDGTVDGSDAFCYSPYAVANHHEFPGMPLTNHAWIRFYNVRIAGIEDVSLGDADQLAPKDNKETVTLTSVTNSTSVPARRKIKLSDLRESTKTSDETFGAMVSAEYKRTVEASAGIKIAEAKTTEEVTLKAESSYINATHQTDMSGSSTEDETEYTIPPNTRIEFIGSRSQRKVHQDVFVTGKLETSVQVWCAHGYNTWFDRLDDVYDLLRGMSRGSGNIYNYYKNNPMSDELAYASISRPRLTISIPINANLSDVTNITLREVPIS